MAAAKSLEHVKSLGGATPQGRPGQMLSEGLTYKADDHRIEFSFDYRQIPFTVHASSQNQVTNVELEACLGYLPYTAENAELRATALAIVRAASEGLGGRVYLDEQKRIILSDAYRLDEPLTPQTLLTNTVRLLLEAKPYLELITLVVPPPLAAREAAE